MCERCNKTLGSNKHCESCRAYKSFEEDFKNDPETTEEDIDIWESQLYLMKMNGGDRIKG